MKLPAHGAGNFDNIAQGAILSPGGFCGNGGVSNRKDHPFRVVFLFGAPSGTRTQGPLIKSQLLYQLS